jgi:hypothetical protein
MKKSLLMLLALCLTVSSCEKDDKIEETYPKDIPVTEYFLEETSCRWTNIDYDANVIIINSQEELANYLDCPDENIAINFSTSTLLLISGRSPNQPASLMNASFVANDKNSYALDMTVFTGLLTSPSVWCFAILVPKIDNAATIALNVQATTDYNYENK